jgi:AraC family transcriptional regulator of adaptative response/methylated-DNA-[protein]-cysteine methyltransferase
MTATSLLSESTIIGNLYMAMDTESDSVWEQVLARDRRADGQFVYAVQSTGIYCKPSCASRRPSRSNVRFFVSCEDAEAAGFRACLRCKPALKHPVDDAQVDAIGRAARMLRSDSDQHLSLDEIARSVGLSRFALSRGFRRMLGVTPADFARAQRRERLRNKLAMNRSSVTEAIYAAGFGSSSRLYESTADTLGMKPSTMKAGGAGETIHWTASGSPLGRMLVAATERGLCCVLFAESDKEAERELHDRFKRATLLRDDARLGETVRYVLSQMTESPAAASLPFDVRATSFQHRVWNALRAIPRGETRSYGQIAKSIGVPKAVRAVGAACGANPLAVVVPCHRAVAADGRLTGYRWGVARKRLLLEIECGER